MADITKSQIMELTNQHNFWTWSAQSRVNPISIDRAEGVYFWDVDGKRYLDFNSMTMCSNIGHGNPHVISAIQEQAEALAYAGPRMATKPRAQLGSMLAEITPGNLNRFLYTLGGADANENAVKIAREFTGKHKILSRYRSYHGATFGAIALTGDPRRWAWEPSVMPGVVHFLDPYRYRSTFHRLNPEIPEDEFSRDYLNHLEEIIMLEGPSTIAAILIETVTGTNGIIIPPTGYLKGVRELCDRYDILMICDEVMSGFGRTGEWFAINHWNVIPDMITMAKGITSGYAPLGVLAMREEIADFFKDRVFQGGLTYNGHPISLAAAIANIKVIQNDKILEHVKNIAPVFHQKLLELKEKHHSVGDVRAIGLFGILELVRDQKTREPLSAFNESSSEMKALNDYLLSDGIYLYTHWNTILLVPPLIINEDELAQGLMVIDDALNITDSAIGESK
jgi:taurine--2-oxoglutarate transaminase